MPFNDMLLQRIVSCLPYDIAYLDEEHNPVHMFKASKSPIRVIEEREQHILDILGIGHMPLVKITSRLSRIPIPADGVSYLVSLRILQMLTINGYDTSDMYAPYDLVWKGRKIEGFKTLLSMNVAPQ